MCIYPNQMAPPSSAHCVTKAVETHFGVFVFASIVIHRSTNILHIGGSDTVTLNVVVNNKGEDAFLATLKVVVPPGLQFVRVERKQVVSLYFCWSSHCQDCQS